MNQYEPPADPGVIANGSDAHGDESGAVFHGAAVVQLMSPDATAPDAVVESVVDATLHVDGLVVEAGQGASAWRWHLGDMERLVHGDEGGWTIFEVPGVSEFGVAVAPGDVEAFRTLVERAPNAVVVHQRSSVRARELVPAGPLPVAPPPPVTVRSEPSPEPRHRRRNRFGRQVIDRVEDVAGPVSLTGIDARNISAWFGTHMVLDRVSLDMPPGQVTALIGPSGCGKSTFLRILNRMHEMIPSASMAGEVIVDGHDVYDPNRKLTDARREIGMVFQKPNPFPAMSIYDNVLAALRVTGTKVTTQVKDELVESCLRKAGLWNEVKDRLRQPGGGLSGGQQQRLCIARALALRPRVLLMDEPCSALDPTSTRRIEETIGELISEVTIVIVTHNMQQAARVSHQCAFFLAEHGTPGVIVEHGPTEAMFGAPRDQRTNDYVNGRFG
jgi:phosphate transport system ATP-binding protein